jgi:hypothetical protein
MDNLFSAAVIVGLAIWTGALAARRGQVRWHWVVAALIVPVFSLLALLFYTRISFLRGRPKDLLNQVFWWKTPKSSRKALKQARRLEQDYKQAIKHSQKMHADLESQLKEVEDVRGKKLKRLQVVLGLEIYELWISTPVWSGPIDGVEAEVVDDSQVVQRLTLTRFAIAGPLSIFAPKRSTHGDVRLLVSGPEFRYAFAISVKDKSAAQKKAYDLANTINHAAMQAEGLRRQRQETAKELRPLANQSVPSESVRQRFDLIWDFVEGLPDELRDYVESRLSISKDLNPGSVLPPPG